MAAAIDDRRAVDEAPEPVAEGALALAQLEKGPRVADGGVDLGPVAHDAGIGQQSFPFPVAEARDGVRIEVCERAPVGVALAQDRQPGQPRLRSLEDQHLEQVALVARGHAPLVVVVGDVGGVAETPFTADARVGHGRPVRARSPCAIITEPARAGLPIASR